jgi:hypothetical protein
MAYLSGCRRKGKHPFQPTGGGVLLQQILQQKRYIAMQHNSIFAAKFVCLGRTPNWYVKYYFYISISYMKL